MKVAFFPYTPFSDIYDHISTNLIHHEIYVDNSPPPTITLPFVIVCTYTQKAVFIINKCRGIKNANIVWIGHPMEETFIKGAINFNINNDNSYDKEKFTKFLLSSKRYRITINPSPIKELIDYTLPMDLLSLLQSALYIAAPKIKRKLCRFAMLEWLKSIGSDKVMEFNSFMTSHNFKAVPEALNSKIDKWLKSDNKKPNFNKFLSSISKDLSKNSIIELGKKEGLSSFESITLHSWLYK